MRQRQSRILHNMAQQINTCNLACKESLILAQLFAKIADQLSQTNPANDLLNDIESYLQVFRNRNLPKTREEFETRATLLQLLRELELYQLKVGASINAILKKKQAILIQKTSYQPTSC